MTINYLTNLINAMQHEDDEPRPYIGASNIGSGCMRQIWYGYKGYHGQPHMARSQRSMDIGKKFESMVLDWLEGASISVTRPNKENNYLEFYDSDQPYFRGHADALLPDLNAVIDIKVVKASSYREFVNKGLRTWSPLYYSQLQAYMGMKFIPYGYLLALNKDTSELHDERIDFDSEYYDSLKMRAEFIHVCQSEPPKISQNPSWWLCKMCKYRAICHG